MVHFSQVDGDWRVLVKCDDMIKITNITQDISLLYFVIIIFRSA